MRDQYVGDISDFLKFALLRALANDGHRLGVAWYYNRDHDGRADGRHTDYILDDKWDALDPTLRSEMKRFFLTWQSDASRRTVRELEQLRIWPELTIFHGTGKGEAVPGFVKDRAPWSRTMVQRLTGSQLVFLDPDNGVHLRPTIRHATFHEVRELRSPGRALVLIKFPAFVKYSVQIENYHRSLCDFACAKNSLTMRTQTLDRRLNENHNQQLRRWFTLIDFNAELEHRFRKFHDLLNKVPGVSAQIN